MQSSQPDQPKRPGQPDRPRRSPDRSPQRRPERHAPGRKDRDHDDRDPATPYNGQRPELRKPPNRR